MTGRTTARAEARPDPAQKKTAAPSSGQSARREYAASSRTTRDPSVQQNAAPGTAASRAPSSRQGTASPAPASRSGQAGAPVRKKTQTAAARPERSVPTAKPENVIRLRGGVDRPMLILIILLLCFGSVMVFSASYAYAFSSEGDSFYYIKRQLIFVAVGLAAMIVAIRFDYQWLRKATVPVFLVTSVLLVGVLVYGVARGKAQRWISIGSLFTLQPSEIMKFSLVLMLALYCARNQDRITNYKNFWQSSVYGIFIPAALVGGVCLLVALESHFSGTILLFMIGMVVIFAGGGRKLWFVVAGIAAALVITPFMLFSDYAKTRLTTWLHPELADKLGEGWQTFQGLNAVGSGGLFGVGLGNSRQKHLFVSEPQNDFIFSIICEELGFIGALAVIILFILFVWRGFVIALKAPDTFSSLVVTGLVGKVAIQAMLNMAVVTSLIPNTGISLPFFSYGGTALMMQLGEMGILLSISRYSYQKK